MIEFRPDGTAVELDDSFAPITFKGRVRLVSNGVQAVSILGPGKRRAQLIEQYEQAQRLRPKPVTTVSVQPIRETALPQEEPPVVVAISPEQGSEPSAIDGQAEAQEFLSTVEYHGDPSWVPDYRDWFDCALKFRLPNAFAVVGELSNGDEIFIHEREFTVRAGGGHTLCLPGAKVAVRMEINPSNHRYRYRALECQFLGETTEYETHAIGTVLSWTGSLGGCRMDCSCSILIGTASRDEQMSLDEGDRIEFDIVFKEKIQKWTGTNITVLESRPKE